MTNTLAKFLLPLLSASIFFHSISGQNPSGKPLSLCCFSLFLHFQFIHLFFYYFLLILRLNERKNIIKSYDIYIYLRKSTLLFYQNLVFFIIYDFNYPSHLLATWITVIYITRRKCVLLTFSQYFEILLVCFVLFALHELRNICY